MSNRRISMLKIRRLLEYFYEKNLSRRKIALLLKISKDVVAQYIIDFKLSGLSYNEIKQLSDDELLEIFEKKKVLYLKDKYKTLSEKFPYFYKELKKVGVTLQVLWDEYIAENPEGYKYSQFCFHYHVWKKNDERLSMHIDHKAGDKMFVDFTGKKLYLVNWLTGEKQEVEVFVAILGASGYTYAEASISQKKEEWIKLNENAFHYFGGVTNAIVPDCLKSAVTISNKYEPDINPEFDDFATHYGTVILPARPNKPKDKALAENIVKIIYSRVFAPLRSKTFNNIESLNEAIWEKLADHNNKDMQLLKASRTQLFHEVEKNTLQPLPAEKYECKKFQISKVQFNYHIFLKEDKHYYSVPYKYVGKTAKVIYTYKNVEIFINNVRIASYIRDIKANGYTTEAKHMPPHHKYYAKWNKERFLNWARDVGNNTKVVINKIFEKSKHPEQAFKVCMGILSLSKKHGKDKLEKASTRAINFELYTYKSIKNILEKGLYKFTENNQLKLNLILPEHDNIRGQQYYSGGEYHDE